MCHPWPSPCVSLWFVPAWPTWLVMTGTPGVWDFGSLEDLGCSIVEGCSTSIVDRRTSKRSTSIVDRRNVEKTFNVDRLSNVENVNVDSIVERRTSKKGRSNRKTLNVERRSSNGQGHVERFRDFGEYGAVRKGAFMPNAEDPN
jgi:hypothetical protein